MRLKKINIYPNEYMRIFPHRSRAANSAVRYPIRANFKLIYPATANNEEDSIKMKTLEWSQQYAPTLRYSKAANSVVSDEI